jgi:hypothetical protein
VSTPVVTDSSSLVKTPVEKYLEPEQTLESIPPLTLSIQHELVHAKTPVDILLITESNKERLDGTNLATSLHCIARRKVSELVLADHRLESLISRVGTEIDKIGIVGLSNTLWSLVKLDKFREVDWFSILIDRMVKTMPSCPTGHLASNLFAVADICKKNSTESERMNLLIDSIVSSLHTRGLDSVSTSDLISVSTSLARLGRLERSVMSYLADRVMGQIDAIPIDQLTSVLWAFTVLKISDKTLYSKIQSMLESRAPTECSKRNLVDLVWSLAKGGPGDESLSELFKFTMAPLLRTHMMEMTVRELSTVLWSFATAEIVDFDFYNDVAHALIPKVAEMNAHDVSSIVWALSSVHYSHSDLLRNLKHQAHVLRNQFTPLQLSRVVYGLGAADVRDRRVMTELVDACKKRMHLLYTQNVVEILMGLSHVEMLDLAGSFFEALSTQTARISGRDAVQVLKALGQLGHTEAWTRYPDLIAELEQIVQTRFNCSGRWIPNGYDFCDLVEAMGKLRLGDRELMERVLIHLSTIYKSPLFTADLFLRFLASVSSFSRNSEELRTLKKLLLMKEKGIQVAVSTLSEQVVMHASGKLSLASAIEILGMYSQIGFQDESVLKLAELIQETFHQEAARDSLSVSSLVHACTSLAQLQILPDFAFELCEFTTESLVSRTEVPADEIMDLVWARLALADDPTSIPSELIHRMMADPSWIPRDVFRAKQVCMSLGDLSPGLTKRIVKMRAVVKPASTSKRSPRSLSRSIDKYESLISFSLSELRVKHIQHFVAVKDLYTVSVSLGPGLCIDLLGPEDVVAPRTDKWSGEKLLKNLNLAQNGCTVVSVTMRQVQSALESNSLKPLIADLIAPYNEKGRERVSFKKIDQNKVIDDLLDS